MEFRARTISSRLGRSRSRPSACSYRASPWQSFSSSSTAADVVLCRAGASTIAEIAAIAKPAVLVPSPNVVADHQTKNARVLANAGGAVLLPEGESSGEKLYALMTGLLSDAPRREAMSRALRDMAVPDAAEQIYQTLVRLMEKRAN